MRSGIFKSVIGLFLFGAMILGGWSACLADWAADEKEIDLISLPTKNPDPSVRHAAYLDVLATVFDSICTDCLSVKTEMVTDEIGAAIQFQQTFRGMPVLLGGAWLFVNTDQEATRAGITYHNCLALPNESYLSIKDDQEALRNYAEQFCLDWDSVSWVDPVVYPRYEAAYDTFSYCYALLAYPYEVAPGRILRWSDGELLVVLPQSNIEGRVYAEHKRRHDGVDDLVTFPEDSAGTLCVNSYWQAWTQPYDYNGISCEPWSLHEIRDSDQNGYFSIPVGDFYNCWDHISLWGKAQNNINNRVEQEVRDPNSIGETWRSDYDHPESFAYHHIVFDRNPGPDTEVYYVGQTGQYFKSVTGGQRFRVRYVSQTGNVDSMFTVWGGAGNGGAAVGLRSEYNGNHWDQFRDVIGHEFGHVVEYTYRTPFGLVNDHGSSTAAYRDAKATGEGLADFMAEMAGEIWDDPSHYLIFPTPGTEGGYILRDFAPAGRTYDNYIENASNPADWVYNGHILSAALWDFWSIVRSHNTDRAMIVQAICAFHQAWAGANHPHTIIDAVEKIAHVLDNNGTFADGIRAGQPDAWIGQALYQAFWLNRHIPLGLPLKGDGWAYYKCVNNTAPLMVTDGTTDGSGLGSAASTNLVVGQWATYAVAEVDHDVILSWTTDNGGTWHQKVVGNSPNGKSQPSLGLRRVGSADEVYVAYVHSSPAPNTTWGLSMQKFNFTQGGDWCGASSALPQPAIPIDLGTPSSTWSPGPIVLAHGTRPVVLAVCNSNNLSNRGIYAWRLNADGCSWNAADFCGTDQHLVRALSACANAGCDTLFVTWLSGTDHNLSLMEWTANGDAFSHYSCAAMPADGFTASTRRNLTMAYVPSVRALAIAWQGVNSSGNDAIAVCKTRWIGDPALPGFSAVDIVTDNCDSDYFDPSLSAWATDNTAIPSYHHRISMLYTRKSGGTNYLCVKGLTVSEYNPDNANLWVWSFPWRLGDVYGHNASLTNAQYMPNGKYRALYRAKQTDGSPALCNARLVDYQTYYGPYVPLEHESALDEVTGADTLETPLLIADSIVVKEGGSLVIRRSCGSSSQIEFLNYGRIRVEQGGQLKIIGTENDPIIIDNVSSDVTWPGITVEGGQLVMEHVQMFDADSGCVSVYNAYSKDDELPVSLRNCTFDGSKLVPGADALRIWGKTGDSSDVIQNVTIENVADDARGLYLFGCAVRAESLIVRDCNAMYALIEEVTGSFSGCTFQTTDKGQRPSDYGVVFLGTGTTPTFTCCTFEDIACDGGFALDALAGTAPVFGWESEPASNVFRESEDNDACLLRMYGDAPLPIITLSQDGGGENDWYHADEYGIYIRWEDWPYWTYPAWKQYWEPTSTIDNFYPVDPDAFDFTASEVEPWGVCGSARASVLGRGGDGLTDGALDNIASDSTLFRQAMGAEHAENYEFAQGLFRTLARTTADRGLRWQALAHIVGTQRHMAAETWIPGLIDSLITAENSAYVTRVYGKRLLAAYCADREDFPTAISVCTALLGSGLTRRDSLLVALDLVGVQLRAGFQTSGSGLDAASVPAPLKVGSMTEGLALQGQLLAAMQGASGGRASAPVALPTQYALYQNYPNPFNPTTEIRFDLPENAPVELRIFNTLGQQVTTLISETRSAGAYTVPWDGKDANGLAVSTGMYIYQLKAGNFTDTKKMLLMK